MHMHMHGTHNRYHMTVVHLAVALNKRAQRSGTMLWARTLGGEGVKGERTGGGGKEEREKA